MMVSIGRKHLERLKAYEPDDYIQEGSITLWTLIEKKAYNGKGKVSTLFYTAFERRCANLYRDYVLKNLVQIAEADDLYCNGYNTCIMVEDEYAKAYREKHKQQCRAWAEKNGRGAKEKKPVMTAEEKKAKQRERSKAYYEAHKEHYKELKKSGMKRTRNTPLTTRKPTTTASASDRKARRLQEPELRHKKEDRIDGFFSKDTAFFKSPHSDGTACFI